MANGFELLSNGAQMTVLQILNILEILTAVAVLRDSVPLW